MKNCLLLFPLSFYSFSKRIEEYLISEGYKVELINDEFPNNLFGKLMGEFQIPIQQRITEKVITNNYLKDKTYDLILIFKGRGMSKSLINKFKSVSPKVIGYNFDSFLYFKNSLKWYENLTKYSTFDYNDSINHCIPQVELFSSLPNNSNQKIKKYSLSVIVRNHSNRLMYINGIFKDLKEKDVFIFIYEKNILSFIVNFLNNPIHYIKYWNHISFKPLDYKAYIDVLQTSNFTLDLAHPKQSGITIRCFEALSCGTKIITNNKYVFKNSFFNKDNTIFHNLKKKNLLLNYNKIKDNVPKKIHRTIEDFMSELLNTKK